MSVENITYYTSLRLLHLIGMAAWFGTALTVSIIWSRKNPNGQILMAQEKFQKICIIL